MKNAATFFFCLFIVSAVFVLGRAEAQQKSNLDTLINQYSAQNIRALTKETGESYKVSEQKIFYSDIDNDGDSDAIVELSFCESQQCKQTTQSSNVAIFLKNKRGYRFAVGKTFVKFNEDNSIELMGKIKSVKNRKIHVDIYGCEVDDAVCLPKFLYRATYSFKRDRLVKVRA